MSFITRLCVLAAILVAGVIVWHSTSAGDLALDATRLAVQQFENDAAVPGELQQASLAQNWWPLLWPVLVIALGIAILWDEIERLWKREEE